MKFTVKEAADQNARFALTATDVQNGDVVKQLDTGALYFVKDQTQLTSEAGYEPISTPTIAWDHVTGKPTTVADSGLTDALADSDVSTTYAAGKIVGFEQGTDGTTSTQYDINAKAKAACQADKAADADKLGGQLPAYYATAESVTNLTSRVGATETDITNLKNGSAITALDATKLTGTIDIARLPQAALERLYIAENDTARLALTTAEVQNGDVVKVTETGLMYYVKDDTKLGGDTPEQAFEPFTAGTASSVPWTGVTGKPNNLAGYGITDAVNVNEKVTVANAGNAGKILVLNAEGKLDVDITGHVAWANINDKPTSTVQQIDQAVTAATHTNRTVLDALGDSGGKLTYNGNAVAMQADLDKVALGSLTVVDDVDVAFPSAAEGQMALEVLGG